MTFSFWGARFSKVRTHAPLNTKNAHFHPSWCSYSPGNVLPLQSILCWIYVHRSLEHRDHVLGLLSRSLWLSRRRPCLCNSTVSPRPRAVKHALNHPRNPSQSTADCRRPFATISICISSQTVMTWQRKIRGFVLMFGPPLSKCVFTLKFSNCLAIIHYSSYKQTAFRLDDYDYQGIVYNIWELVCSFKIWIVQSDNFFLFWSRGFFPETFLHTRQGK